MTTERDRYEEDLRRRQEEHLRLVRGYQEAKFPVWANGPEPPWWPCAHDQCSLCVGTGVRLDGSACVHLLYCPCPRCSSTC